MTDLEYKGKIEIIGKKIHKLKEEEQFGDKPPLNAYDCKVLFDGKEIPHLELVDVYISLKTNKPTVLLKFIPIELDIKLDDAEVFVRRKEEP